MQIDHKADIRKATEAAVAEFLARGGSITVAKSRKNPRQSTAKGTLVKIVYCSIGLMYVFFQNFIFIIYIFFTKFIIFTTGGVIL